MDEKDLQLYQEEQLELTKNLKASVDKLIEVFTGKVSIEYKQAETQTIDGKVEIANPVTEVAVSNNSEITEALKGFSETLADAIKEAKTEAVKEVKVSNIGDAKVDKVTIGNLMDMTKYFDKVAEAIAENRPIVNVEKTDIKWPIDPRNPIAVRLSNGKAFYNALTAAFSAGIDTSGIETAIAANTVPFADYALARQNLDGDPLYFGYEKANGEWVIKRLSFTDQTTTYYTGNGGISSNWAAHASYDYEEYSGL